MAWATITKTTPTNKKNQTKMRSETNPLSSDGKQITII